MPEDQEDPQVSAANELRRRAAERLEGRFADDKELSRLTLQEIRHLVHELQTHQVELELQNDELRRAQEELAASRDRYADLYDFAPVGYLTIGEKGLVQEANLTSAELLCMDRGALLGQPLSRFILPADQDVYYRHRREALASAQVQSCELRLRQGGDRTLWARLESVSAGEGACRIALNDITARRETADALQREYAVRDSETAVRVRIASMDQPEEWHEVVKEVHQQLRRLGVRQDSASIRIVNSAGTDFASFPLDQSEPRMWEQIADGLAGASWPQETTNTADYPWVLAVWQTGTPRYDPCTAETRAVPAGSSLLEVPFSRGCLAISSGQSNAFGDEEQALLQRFAGVLSDGFQRFIDVARRRRAERELVHLERLRAVGELSAGVSHNLNNILSTVLGPAQLILRCSDDAEVCRDAQEIIDSARRARDLVHRLHLSVRGVAEDKLEAVPLNEVVHEAVQSARPRWRDEPESRGISFEVVTELGEVPSIRGTRSRVRDILTNLLFNAVDAMLQGGTITIATRAAGTEVQLVCSDTGSGMDEETRRRVFEPFFTTKMDVGSGLGLSTAYGTVAYWGGRIQVESAPGQGATFILWLPVWTEAGSQEKDPASGLAPPRRGRVLVADGNERLCRLLSQLLGRHHEVETVRDGREALELFASGHHDVVLVDLGMPDLPGDRVVQEMRRIDPAVGLVLTTGWDLSRADPRRIAFDFRLQKPFEDLDEVEAMVAQALALRDARAGQA